MGSFVYETFDDASFDLALEPLVTGADTVIDRIATAIRNADKSFALFLSGVSLPEHQSGLDWHSAETTKNWYGAQGLLRGNAPLAPSRRNFVRSIGLLAFAAWPAWICGASNKQNFIVVDGWVLVDSDLR